MKHLIFITILVFTFCLTTFAQSNEFTSKMIGEYKLSTSINSGLDNLFIELNNNINLYGVVKIQANSKWKILQQLKLFRDRFAFRCKIDLSRLSYAVIFDKTMRQSNTQYWLMSKEQEISDCNRCIFVKTPTTFINLFNN